MEIGKELIINPKPCPFCGAPARTKLMINNMYGEYFYFTKVGCSKCDVEMVKSSKAFSPVEGPTFEEIIAQMVDVMGRWNERSEAQ